MVLELTKSLVGKNHIIIMDNYFSSSKLFEELKAHVFYSCGTVRPNREGLPMLGEEIEER